MQPTVHGDATSSTLGRSLICSMARAPRALTQALRRRGAAARQQAMANWGGYVHYLAEGLELLPDYAGVAYRALGGRWVGSKVSEMPK